MIYSHIWESKPFLKSLYRLGHGLKGENYHWKLTVPTKIKHLFITANIRDIFSESNSKLADIIQLSYHSSLRNAFAHSDYYFETMNDINSIDEL